jgi:hypothetical protein
MGDARHDIDVKFYLDGVTWLAFKHRCQGVHRSLSEHLRHLVEEDLLSALDAERLGARSDAGPPEGPR